jgi:hypothetical protein
MDSGIVVSLITGGTALVVAIASGEYARRASHRAGDANRDLALMSSKLEGERSRDLALMTSKLEEQRSAEAALRDYQYEARKRLYAECQPLLFEAVLLAEDASYRVRSLADSARRGDLGPDGSGWLDPHRLGYYFKTTAYFLLAPMTVARLLQRRLTVIDLGLDPELQRQYELLKLIYLSFTADFDLAGREPVLRYEPDRADPDRPERDRLLASEPEVYARQGLYRGVIEDVADALIKEQDGRSRPKTYGEFKAEWDQKGTPVQGVRENLIELFSGFHPERKPVLWRVLVAQHLLYAALVRSDEPPGEGTPTDADLSLLNWHQNPLLGKNEVRAELHAAEAYVRPRLSGVKERVQARGGSAS